MRAAVLLALLLVLPLAADDFPLTGPDVAPATGRKFSVDAAWNGSEFLAAWSDERAGVGQGSVYAARLRGDGSVIDTLGIPVAAQAGSPKVAADGNDFVVVYHRWDATDSRRAYFTRIQDGRVAGTPVVIGSGSVSALVTNGNSFCMLFSQWPASLAVFTDRFGTVESVVRLPNETSKLVTAGGRYWALASDARRALTLFEVTPDGIGEGRVVGTASFAAIAATRDRIVIAWTGINARSIVAEYVVLDGDGEAVSSARVEEAVSFTDTFINPPLVAWDGREFLVAWQANALYSRAIRLWPDGMRAQTAFPEFLWSSRNLATANNGATTLVVTIEGEDELNPNVIARTLPSLADPPATTELLSASAIYQDREHTAAIGPVALTVFTEDRGRGAVGGVLTRTDRTTQRTSYLAGLSGRTHKFPSVTASGHQFLAAWVERLGGASGQLLAQRVGIDGSLRDPDPIRLQYGGGVLAYQRPGAASDGTDFLVAWSTASGRDLQRVHAALVRADGTIAKPLELNASEQYKDVVRAVWTGSLYAVVWSESADIFMVRVTADGLVLDAEPVVLFRSAARLIDKLEVASDGHGHGVVLWDVDQCLRAAALTAEGIAGAPQVIACTPGQRDGFDPMQFTAAWNGSGFTIFWAAGEFGHTTLQYTTVSERLDPLVTRTILRDTDVVGVAAAATESSIFLTYDRSADDPAFGGTRRVFGRFFAKARFGN